ncbi:MAG: hypothetical protein ACK54L_16220, partial [Betaproteobacteria bacterium]
LGLLQFSELGGGGEHVETSGSWGWWSNGVDRNLRHQLVRCTNRIVGAGKRMSSKIFASQQIMVMQAFKPNKSAICDLLPGLNGGPAWYLVPVGAGAKRAFGDDHHCGGAP